MNGYLVGGLADGLISGFNAVTQWNAMKKEQDRQDKQDARQAQLDASNEAYRQRTMGLADAQLDLSKQKQAAELADNSARLGILQDTLGLDKTKTAAQIAYQRGQLGLAQDTLGLDKTKTAAQIELQKGQFGLAQAANLRADQDQQYQNLQNQYKAAQMKRQEDIQFAQNQIYPKFIAGNATPADVMEWKKRTGLDLADLTNDHFIDEAVGVMHGLKTGQVKHDDPRVNEVADRLYGGMLQRGIGDKVKVRDAQGNPTGPEITVEQKAWAGAYPRDDGRFGLNTWVIGKDAQGNMQRSLAPVTLHGTGGKDDPIVSFSGDDLEKPLVAAMHFNHAFNQDPVLRANIKRVLSGETDTKSEAEKLKLMSEVDKNKAAAEHERAQTENERGGGGSKAHEGKMQDARSMAKDLYGGKMNALDGTIIGAEPDGYNATIEGADKLLRENPKLSSADAFQQARKGYEATKGQRQAEKIGADYKAGKIDRKEAAKRLKEAGFN
jgi:hypothetical protein